jgi:hypothetical protein
MPRAHLASLGIPADRLKIAPTKEFPFDPGHDDSAWAKTAARTHYGEMSVAMTIDSSGHSRCWSCRSSSRGRPPPRTKSTSSSWQTPDAAGTTQLPERSRHADRSVKAVNARLISVRRQPVSADQKLLIDNLTKDLGVREKNDNNVRVSSLAELTLDSSSSRR